MLGILNGFCQHPDYDAVVFRSALHVCTELIRLYFYNLLQLQAPDFNLGWLTFDF